MTEKQQAAYYDDVADAFDKAILSLLKAKYIVSEHFDTEDAEVYKRIVTEGLAQFIDTNYLKEVNNDRV